MTVSFSRLLTIITLFGFLGLAGCGSKPTLETKNPAVPAGVDLSGFWELRQDPGESKRPNAAGSDESLIILSRSQRKQRSTRQRSSGGASAHVFLEFGDALKVTQTHYGLFISYDRSVVEEYTFGENREVTIGPIEARRVSGWEAGAFVVETLDDSSTILSESWRLAKSGDVLVRDIRISKGEDTSFEHQQLFDRQ